MEDRLIANILYKELFSYNTVFLQNVGYISLVSHPASLSADGSTLTPPYKTISLFQMDEIVGPSVDLVMAISQASMIDYSEAYAMYSNFLSSHVIGNILNIPLVMTINLDDFSILRLDDRIINALEGQDLSTITVAQPIRTQASQGRSTVKAKLSSTPGAFMITMASMIVLSAIAYLVYYFYF